ncbi:ubiquitin-specific protease otu1 [Bachmanniomyces sp. S44760]|nr:ubiquitin-specific protease otu1 [Bachmanniomyces sp. S44760]
MKIRIRGPSGQSMILLDEAATVGDLRKEISGNTSITNFDVKYNYPPKSLFLDAHPASAKVSDLGIKLDGEQLIISEKPGSHSSRGVLENAEANETAQSRGVAFIEAPSSKESSPLAFAALGQSPAVPEHSKPKSTSTPRANSGSLSLSRKPAPEDPPELAIPTHAATMLLRIMPDDNSCLFRAFGSAFFGEMDNMTELRSIIAQSVQADPDKYSSVVLEKAPDDYCRWIQTEDAWGGAIELDILSKHFDLEISSVDVQTLRVDRFNEGSPTRCILVYSGIHYDVIALSPSDHPYTHAYAPPDFDTKVFDTADQEVLDMAVELCRVLQGQHYFTDTAKFRIKCNVCGTMCTGEKGATEHAQMTGHYDFGEAG